MLSHEWQKSSYSSEQDCVEARLTEASDGVQVRDSKHPDAGSLTFTPSEWDAFVSGIKAGQFQIP